MRHNKFLDNLCLILVFSFLFLPILVLILFSFNTSEMNIVFEGIDASGKTTLIRELQGYLNYKGIKNKVIADVKEKHTY